MQEKEQEIYNDDKRIELEEQSINTKRLQVYAIMGLCALVLVLLGIYFINSFKKEPKEEIKEPTNIESSVKEKTFEIPKEETLADILEKNPDPTPQLNTQQSLPMLAMDPKPNVPRIVKGQTSSLIATEQSAQTQQNHYDQSYKSEHETIDRAQNYINQLMERNPNNTNIQQNNSTRESDSYHGEVYTPTAANIGAFDENLLLPKGTYIGCSLKTKIISEVKGGIACTISNDVYSANGNILLIEKGSTVAGQFKSGQIDDGVNRLFVIWQEVRTPNNVVIPMDSGGSDALGASGISGYIDNHYIKRFGSAILLSVIDDSLLLLSNSLGNNTGYGIYAQGARETSNNIANTTLQKMINIKPTLYKNQGDIVGIYVNRDIDFSKVYTLRNIH